MTQISLETNIIQYDGVKLPYQIEAAPTQGAAVVKAGTAENEVLETSGDNQVAVGVINEVGPDGTLPAADDKVTVYGPGNVVWCEAAATVTYGAYAMSAAAGKIKDVAATAATTFSLVGIILSAGASGDWVPVLVTLGKQTNPA